MNACIDAHSERFNSCVMGMTDGNVYIWDTNRRECSVTFENAHSDTILDARLLFGKVESGDVLVLSGSKDGIVKLWNADSGQLIHQYELKVPRSKRCRTIWFPRPALSAPRGFFQQELERYFFASYDNLVNQFDVDTGKVISTFGEEAGPTVGDTAGWVSAIHAVSPSLIVTAGSSKDVSLWDVRSPPQQPVSKIEGQHTSWIRCLQVHGWNHCLATGSTDKMLRIFDLRNQSILVNSFGPLTGRVNALQMDFDKIVRPSCPCKFHIFLLFP